MKAGADGSGPQEIRGLGTRHYQGYLAHQPSHPSPSKIAGPERDAPRLHSQPQGAGPDPTTLPAPGRQSRRPRGCPGP